MIQTKSLVEQITPLVQRPVEEEEVFQRSPMDLEPPLPPSAPRAAGLYAYSISSPKCPIAYGSTHQMTSPGTMVSPYRADIMRGIS